MHWYPLFYFPNGDAFCLDIRNGTVVFYEHEIYESEKNLHGLLIAILINDVRNQNKYLEECKNGQVFRRIW